MTFTPNIPQSGQSLGATRTLVNGNFTNYNNLISQDHFAPNNGNQGKHKQSTYVEVSNPTTAANEIAVYAKDAAGVSQLFMRRESNGTVIQMSVGDPVVGANGSTFLPGGIILKWGEYVSGGDGAAISFVSPFPTTCWLVILTPISGSTVNSTIFVRAASVTASQFITDKAGSSNYPIRFMAIGN